MTPVVKPRMWAVPNLETSSGCFETMRAYHGKIFRLSQHMGRLYASAAYLGVVIPMAPDAMARRLTKALDESGIREAVVRVALIPVSSRGGTRVAEPSLVVVPVQMPTAAQYRTGIRVAVVPTKRFPVGQIDPQSKFSARLGSIMAVMDAQLRGVDEALFEDAMGYVTESTASNLGIIKDGVFLASPCWLGLLAGITWQALVEVAHALQIPVKEVPLTRHDLYNADEAFLSSTIKEVLPVTVIDGRAIGTGRPGPHADRLRRGFARLVKRELRVRG